MFDEEFEMFDEESAMFNHTFLIPCLSRQGMMIL
jgi:hypothetical protein